ncbi:CLUMA_CG015242, isoform A, partial [Clunio marinus]
STTANDRINQFFNNNATLTSQNNSTAVINIENCNGIHFGMIMNVGFNRTPDNVDKQMKPLNVGDEQNIYMKTPTIKEMMESKEPLSPIFLNIVSEEFGSRWREFLILLQIDTLFVDRMREDHFDKGGTSEVVYRVLSKFFQENFEKANIGWIISFLWKNDFRKTVWKIKESYKQLKNLNNKTSD